MPVQFLRTQDNSQNQRNTCGDRCWWGFTERFGCTEQNLMCIQQYIHIRDWVSIDSYHINTTAVKFMQLWTCQCTVNVILFNQKFIKIKSNLEGNILKINGLKHVTVRVYACIVYLSVYHISISVKQCGNADYYVRVIVTTFVSADNFNSIIVKQYFYLQVYVCLSHRYCR